MDLAEHLSGQYGHSWKMLKDGIKKCTDLQWKSVADDSFFVPARLAFHVIQTVDFYTSPNANDFDWAAHGFDWEACSPELLPDRSSVSKYLSKIEEKVEDWLMEMNDESLIGSDTAFSPYFKCPLERILYAVRHSHHHIGQMSLDLQRRSLPEIEW